MFSSVVFLSLFLTVCPLLLYFYRKYFLYWAHHKSVASVPGIICINKFREFITFKTNFAYHLKTIYDDPAFVNEPVVGICGFLTPGLLLREPEIIKSVLIRDFDVFCDRFGEADPVNDPLGALSLFFARYKVWKKARAELSPAFTTGKLKSMYPLIQQIGENVDTYLKTQPSVFDCDMKEVCTLYTTDVIATTIFGLESNSLKNPMEEVNVEVRKLTYFNWKRAYQMLLILCIPKWVPFFKAKTYYDSTEDFLKTSIRSVMEAREKSNQTRNDVIDIFIKLKHIEERNVYENEKFFEYLSAQAGILLIGGFDTSSTTIANALLELTKQPHLQDLLRKEIFEAMTTGNGEISYEALNNMQYLDMVVCETLRMYPVLPLLERKYVKPLTCSKPYTLKPYCDFILPDGMPMYISTYALHYDAKYWSNPCNFDPERFSPDNKHLVNPMVYLPFGNGPHNCIGMRLGQLQVKIGLISILKNHFVRVYEKTITQPKFNAKSVTLQVVGGIYLKTVRDRMCDETFNKAC